MRLVGAVEMAEIVDMERRGLSKEKALDVIRERARLDHGRACEIRVVASENHTGFDIWVS